MITKRDAAFIFAALFLLIALRASGQTTSVWKSIEEKPSTLHLDQGMISFNTLDFQLQLVKSSQTVAALHPNTNKEFDFIPGELLEKRSRDGLYQLGDLNLVLE